MRQSCCVDVSEFDYHLPEELIAQRPLDDRAASRMLVLHRGTGSWEDRMFRDLPEFLSPEDCLVLNDSKVFPSRLFGRRVGTRSLPIGKHNPKRWQYLTGRVEVFLLRPISEDRKTWEALVRPGRKMQVGERIRFEGDLEAEIIGRGEFGERMIRFEDAGDIYDALDRIGHVPLPPYIRRPDSPEDRERYQTVFAREAGSVAAPTAGLHFTPEMFEKCRAGGVSIATVTLHVGLGTFQPIHTDVVERHSIHSEHFEIPEHAWRQIESASRVVAVGTTSVRSIETAARGKRSGETDLFIYPGFRFAVTGAMLTNFHLPQSSLLVLVAAFAGHAFVMAAYRHAVEQRYRFYSYGDCMLIL